MSHVRCGLTTEVQRLNSLAAAPAGEAAAQVAGKTMY